MSVSIDSYSECHWCVPCCRARLNSVCRHRSQLHLWKVIQLWQNWGSWWLRLMTSRNDAMELRLSWKTFSVTWVRFHYSWHFWRMLIVLWCSPVVQYCNSLQCILHVWFWHSLVCHFFCDNCLSLFTVKPLILATLNFGVWVNLIILDPVISAFLLPTTLNRTVFKFSRPVIFVNLSGSQNSRNRGHVKKMGFTVRLCYLQKHNSELFIFL